MISQEKFDFSSLFFNIRKKKLKAVIHGDWGEYFCYYMRI